MIRIEKTTPSSYRVYFNDIYLGDAEMEVDGFYNFWFSKDTSGYWTSHSLRLIAEMLDDLNKEWNDKMNDNLVVSKRDDSYQRPLIIGRVLDQTNNRKFVFSKYDMYKHNIQELSDLSENWDGFGACKISDKIIELSLQLLLIFDDTQIDKITDLYPNPNGTICFEFESSLNKLVLEIGEANYSYFINKYNEKPIFIDKYDLLQNIKEIKSHIGQI